MLLSKPWDPMVYNTKFTIEEHLHSLPAIPAGTCKDLYNKEGNIIFSTEVDNAGDIIVTMVDDDGNTIVSMVDDEVYFVPTIDLADDSIQLEFVDYSDDDVSSISSSQSSVRSHHCHSYTKCYQPPSPKKSTKALHQQAQIILLFHIYL